MKNTPVTPDVDARVEIFKQFLTDIEAAGPSLQSAPAAPDVEALLKAYAEARSLRPILKRSSRPILKRSLGPINNIYGTSMGPASSAFPEPRFGN